MKKLLTWILILGAVGGGGWWWLKGDGEGDASAESLTPENIAVERGDLRVVVQATGKVVANATVEVKSKASGEIIRLPFLEGDSVRQGDLLAELDPDDESRNVQRAESSLQSAQARLEQSRRELQLMESNSGRYLVQAEANLQQASVEFTDALARYERRQGLVEEGVLNQEEYDAANTALEQARSSLRNAQAAFEDAQNYPLNIELRRQDVILAETTVHDQQIALEQARERFEDTRIAAPCDGVITDLPVERGQIITSGTSNVSGGTTLMTISDLSRLFIEVKVDETDIGTVRVGQSCVITADAFPGEEFMGTVAWIAPQGLEESNIITFEVKVEVQLGASPEEELTWGGGDEASGETEARRERRRELARLMPNMTANVEIITADLHDVLLLPNEAIQTDEEGRPYVELASGQGSGEAVASAAGPPRGSFSGSGESSRRGGRRSEGGWQGGQRGQRPEGEGRSGGGRGPRPDRMGPRASSGEASAEGFASRSGAPRRYIEVGPSDGVNTQVLHGLREGDEIQIPVPEWLLNFRENGAAPTDERTRQRARRMMM